MTTIRVESYWDWLPPEIQEYIILLAQYQYAVDRVKHRWLTVHADIFLYARLKVEWGLGPLVLKHWNCALHSCKSKIPGTNKHLVILGKYKDPDDDFMRKEILGLGFKEALENIKETRSFFDYLLDRSFHRI